MGSFHFHSASAGHPLPGYITIKQSNTHVLQKQDKNSSDWQMGSLQSAFAPWTATIAKIYMYLLLFMCRSVTHIALSQRWSRGGGEKEGVGVKWASDPK